MRFEVTWERGGVSISFNPSHALDFEVIKYLSGQNTVNGGSGLTWNHRSEAESFWRVPPLEQHVGNSKGVFVFFPP